MTREQAKAIMDHLDIVRHYANGGDLEWRIHSKWGETSTMNLCCLHTGNYRIKRTKPHYKLTLESTPVRIG